MNGEGERGQAIQRKECCAQKEGHSDAGCSRDETFIQGVTLNETSQEDKYEATHREALGRARFRDGSTRVGARGCGREQAGVMRV